MSGRRRQILCAQILVLACASDPTKLSGDWSLPFGLTDERGLVLDLSTDLDGDGMRDGMLARYVADENSVLIMQSKRSMIDTLVTITRLCQVRPTSYPA